MDLVGLSIAGPNARKVLAKLTDEDVSGEAFRFLDFRETHLAAVPVMVNRVTYTGDLGYEIWVKPEYQRRLYDKVMEAGEEFGIVNFGMRALLSMRLEKNWPTWYRELRPIYGPFEADAGRFVDLKKNDFIGREAAAREKEDGGKLRRVTFIVEPPMPTCSATSRSGTTARWWAGSPPAATPTTSTARWRRAMCRRSSRRTGGGFEIEILGERRPAQHPGASRCSIRRARGCGGSTSLSPRAGARK